MCENQRLVAAMVESLDLFLSRISESDESSFKTLSDVRGSRLRASVTPSNGGPMAEQGPWRASNSTFLGPSWRILRRWLQRTWREVVACTWKLRPPRSEDLYSPECREEAFSEVCLGLEFSEGHCKDTPFGIQGMSAWHIDVVAGHHHTLLADGRKRQTRREVGAQSYGPQGGGRVAGEVESVMADVVFSSLWSHVGTNKRRDGKSGGRD